MKSMDSNMAFVTICSFLALPSRLSLMIFHNESHTFYSNFLSKEKALHVPPSPAWPYPSSPPIF